MFFIKYLSNTISLIDRMKIKIFFSLLCVFFCHIFIYQIIDPFIKKIMFRHIKRKQFLIKKNNWFYKMPSIQDKNRVYKFNNIGIINDVYSNYGNWAHILIDKDKGWVYKKGITILKSTNFSILNKYVLYSTIFPINNKNPITIQPNSLLKLQNIIKTNNNFIQLQVLYKKQLLWITINFKDFGKFFDY